ncbi:MULTISPECIES: GNAT family N-acetyltransferase [Bacillus cereus group]|uniref:GNAT family N-acetyltransferase n=1 Tax=Bacillus cereus TaxID=1396 RepID=A0A2C0EU51_BACCE|nr:GNAT family N-acetyltransferase [Bacillus cereus]PDY82333.1 GNAT family N-acetyltransferase [Bacillus cereus]PFA17954.1 GNAT family N-acetyltransferase [Bacillus cereus]PFM40525.1 GNAT family N-acetyltransferase [Bacillus cereus]PGL63862.1 GNAT family N-acetyltransferase [Bacillus cereus]PGQ10159.1 GNAT family N-acetyltransferase [Bacillus cereus]
MVHIQKITPEMKETIRRFMCENWGSSMMVSRGRAHQLEQLPGFIALKNDRIVGIITCEVLKNMCEIVSLDSFEEGNGIGTKLVDCVLQMARENECEKVWLITTNDNMNALRFYQKRNFIMTNLYMDAVKEARKIKKEIPFIGYDNIAISHEIQLEYTL